MVGAAIAGAVIFASGVFLGAIIVLTGIKQQTKN